MLDLPGRPGPAVQVRFTERALRKNRHLEQNERLLEWKQGKIERWLVDDSDQQLPKLYGLERIPVLKGMASLSYSPRCLFFAGGDRLAVTDLAFILRIWGAEPRSVCMIYSAFRPTDDGSLVSIRWHCDEREGFYDVAAFADRIRVRARARLETLPPEWQDRIRNRASGVTASPGFVSQLGALDQAAADALTLRPRTVMGQWLRATCLGMRAESERLGRQLNGGQPGWNDDEPAVIRAASDLAARRYFGLQASPGAAAAVAAEMTDRARSGAELRGTRSTLPEQACLEAVIRQAAGDQNVSLTGFSAQAVFEARSAFTVFILVKLEAMYELDSLICGAETQAFERGFDPPLAAEAG